jgi:hypothetical protein
MVAEMAVAVDEDLVEAGLVMVGAGLVAVEAVMAAGSVAVAVSPCRVPQALPDQ